jgi:hypothetical protein
MLLQAGEGCVAQIDAVGKEKVAAAATGMERLAREIRTVQ